LAFQFRYDRPDFGILEHLFGDQQSAGAPAHFPHEFNYGVAGMCSNASMAQHGRCYRSVLRGNGLEQNS